MTTFQQKSDTVAKAALVAQFFFFPISVGAAYGFMGITLLAWLAAGRYGERWQVIRQSPVMLPALLLYALVLVGIAWTPAPARDIWMHVDKYKVLLLMLLSISLLTEAKWQQRCQLAFMLAMGLILVMVYASIWVKVPGMRTHKLGWGGNHVAFTDHIAQGIEMAFFAVLCIRQALLSDTLVRRAGWAVVVLLATLSITHLSNGQTGVLALVVALAIAGAVLVPRRLAIALVVSVTAAVAILLASSSVMQNRIQTSIRHAQEFSLSTVGEVDEKKDITSIGARIYFWTISARMIAEHPLLGMGTGAYHGAAAEAMDNEAWCKVGCFHPHNQFLFFGVEYGAVGIAIFLFFLASPVPWALRQEKATRAVVLAFLGIFVVDSVTHGALWLAREQLFFTLVMALLVAGATSRQQALRP